MKLSKTQQELHEAMLRGVTCHYMPYSGRFNPSAYYFRSDTMKKCSKAAAALLKLGLVERFNVDLRGCELRAIQPTATLLKLTP